MTNYNPEEIESAVSKQWNENNTRKRALNKNEGGEIFYFLDGPPYASGSMHIGTAMGKIIKDYFIRYYRMNGYYVHAHPGYDTHGLPIENKVEEEQGFESKQDIEEFGVSKFVEKCEGYATKYIDEMSNEFKDMGVWMDWENPYLTLHDYYIEGAWETFREAYKKGYLYKDSYPVHVCTHCETAVAYNEVEYTDKSDPEIYVTMRVVDRNEELMIWTTTPWTLPANTAIMAHPEHKYSLVGFNDRQVWMASELVEETMEKFEVEEYKVMEEKQGSELEGLEYQNPLEEYVPVQKGFNGEVVLSERYVDLEGGTGLVHSAPGHGREDYEVGQAYDLKQLSPVNLKGEFTEQAGKYEGMPVKDADQHIKKDLEDSLAYSGQIQHEYPKCWRCSTPLLQLSIPQWFFGATKFRDTLVEENDKVNWVPDWAGEKFDQWLHQLGDWPVSRQRYWGIPLPIWECNDCSHTKVVGDRDELPEVPDDLHRPYIDDVEMSCEECGGTMERIPDVMDVWFDSGVAPWASLKHPEVDFTFEEEGPVDLEEEGFDQIRGWWNSQFITSIMTHDKRPFDNVIYHGKVKLGGREMSKSKNIGVSPTEVIERYGSDLLRYHILSKNISQDWNFKWDELEDAKEFMNLLHNTYNYKETYTSETQKPETLSKEDKWILSRLNTTIQKVMEHSNGEYKANKAARELRHFAAEDLSRTYIQMVRDRIKAGEDAAEWTLRRVTNRLLKILAPFTPYFAEYQWKGEDSIHLEDYPQAEEKFIDRELERNLEIFQQIEEAVARLRQEKEVKLRHPVKKVTVSGNQEVRKGVENLEELLKKNLNAKEVVFEEIEPEYEVKLDYSEVGPLLGDKVSEAENQLSQLEHEEVAHKVENGENVELAGAKLGPDMFDVRTHVPEDMDGEEFSEGTVYLDEAMTPGLEKEAFLAEVIRAVQQKRKAIGLEVEDEVKLSLNGDIKPLEENEDKIKQRINLSKLTFEPKEFDYSGHVELHGHKVKFSLSDST